MSLHPAPQHTDSPQKDWKISVRIGEERMSLIIPRCTRAEKCIRTGAANAGKLMDRYSRAYPDATKEQILTYVALHLASEIEELAYQEQKDRTNPRLEQLIDQIDKIDNGEL